MTRNGRRVKPCGKIPDAVSIDNRPKDANTRTSVGHWETDNLIGTRTDKTAISTTVERVTRYTILSKLEKTAEAKYYALVKRLWYYPDHVKKTVTTDNGYENVYHKDITKTLSLAVYFCHAYHSWEKGTVENTNGRIRRYIPKGKSIDTLTDEAITKVEYALNHTPRKCLQFRTPHEVMAQALTSERQTKPWQLTDLASLGSADTPDVPLVLGCIE
jgi:IS30 family transposase